MAERATAFLASEPELYLADLVVAETVCVLESFYKAPRDQVAEAMRSLASMRSMITVDPALLLRALEVYEIDRACRPSSASNPDTRQSP
jgi:predicted nucleic-acid-binding protein